MKNTHPDYAAWDAAGKPDCWCYEYNCRGDADGIQEFGAQVQISDLGTLAGNYGQAVTLCDNTHINYWIVP